jgi:type I restriction enzyme M protein
MNNREIANFIWSIADLLRGDYKQAEYGKIILPFTKIVEKATSFRGGG